MAITVDSAVDRIAELWGEIPSARERRWIWMCLKFFRDGLPNTFFHFHNTPIGQTIKSQGQFFGGDIEFELEKLMEINVASIPALKLGRLFNHLTDFDWIDEDIRQLYWLINCIHRDLNLVVPDARARLNDRDYFICLVDLVALPILDKQRYLSSLHQAWLKHLKNTSYLNWFNDDEEPERCDFAWQALESRLDSMLRDSLQLNPVLGQEFRKYPGGVSLQCFFDAVQISDFEKKSHVDHVKKLWGQRKYRSKLEKNKVRQRNFVLSDTTIKTLDKIAKDLGVSRTEALERVVELAAKHGMHNTGKT